MKQLIKKLKEFYNTDKLDKLPKSSQERLEAIESDKKAAHEQNNKDRDEAHNNLDRQTAEAGKALEDEHDSNIEAQNNNHDERPAEVKSDIESTRYELSKEGMYDFNDPNFQFTEEHLEYMRNNPEKFQKFNKVLSRDYEDEVILEMMNDLYTKKKEDTSANIDYEDVFN